jgi:phage shock protein A
VDIDARAFGQLEGEVKALHAMLTEQNATLASLQKQISDLTTTLSEARGGWRTLLWLGGASAAAASAVTWALQHLALVKP